MAIGRRAALLAVIAVTSGCGNAPSHSLGVHSVAETKRAFARHGIVLIAAPPPASLGATFLISVMPVVNVEVYPTIDQARAASRTAFVLGSGTPATSQRRNVAITWVGKEDKRVTAALNDLR